MVAAVAVFGQVEATAAARRAFGELPAAVGRSRRARFCEPTVPFMSIPMIYCFLYRRKSILSHLLLQNHPFLSITCAPNVPHRYF